MRKKGTGPLAVVVVFPLVVLACRTTGPGPAPAIATGERCALIVTDDDIPSGSATAGALYVEESELGRRLLTADVLAAAQGFLDGGLGCVDVVDSHDGAIDPAPLAAIGVPVLTPSATPHWVWPFLGPMSRPYAMAALMGYHSPAGVRGFRTHTINDAIRALRVQGRAVGEVTQEIIGLSAFAVPAVLVSGDMNATAEAAALVPDVEQVTVRWLEPDGGTAFLESEDAGRRLREAARRAAGASHEPYRPELPLRLELETWSAERMRDRAPAFAEEYAGALAEEEAELAATPDLAALLDPHVFPAQAPAGRALAWSVDSAISAFVSISFAASALRPSSSDGVAEGYAAYREGRYEEALASYQLAIDEDPYDVATRCRMAAAHQKLERLDEARRLFAYGFDRLEEIGDDPMKIWCSSGLADVALLQADTPTGILGALQLLALEDFGGSRERAVGLLERATTGPTMAVDGGLQGFFPVEAVTAGFLAARGVGLDADVIRELLPRIGKLVLDQGETTRPEEEVLAEQHEWCGLPHRRLFNETKCRAYDERRCAPEGCTIRAYGNCSGLFLAPGMLVTAGHCVAGLMESDALREGSRILRVSWEGGTWGVTELALGEIRSLKRTWNDSWVIPEPAADDRMDVAVIRFDEPGAGFEHLEACEVPAVGAPLFVLGYPRAVARPAAELAAAGHPPVFGEPSASFGRVVDRNEADAPLCSPTGRQDDWRIASPCASGAAADEEGSAGLRGPITEGPFLSSVDTINGNSGAPLFDGAGCWVGINLTVYGADPAAGWSPQMQPVHLRARSALDALEAAGASSLGPGPASSQGSRSAHPPGQATSSSSSAPRRYCSSGG